MLFLKKPITRIATWSLTFALIAQGPMLCADQRVSETPVNEPAESESIMQDVKLAAKGVLTARIVDVQGNPVVGEHVSLMFSGKEVAAVLSDQDGFVTVSGLRPGLHAIVTPTGTTACRLWNADTAPPTATTVPAVVSDSEVIRGQLGAFNAPMFLALSAGVAGIIIGLDARNKANDARDANAALAARIKALEPASP